MTSVTVCIPHCNSPRLLKACLASVLHYSHPLIATEIVVIDQSDERFTDEVDKACHGVAEMIRIPRIDAGYPLDVAVRRSNAEYFCSLDADCFPISHQWLATPIYLMNETGRTVVGTDTGLGMAYKQYGEFRVINNFYRIMTHEAADFCSRVAGFIRPQHRHSVEMLFETPWLAGSPLSEMMEADNGVCANLSVEDSLKLALPICRHSGRTPKHGIWGMVVADLVYHLVFGYCEATVNEPSTELGSAVLQMRESICAALDPVEFIRRHAVPSAVNYL